MQVLVHLLQILKSLISVISSLCFVKLQLLEQQPYADADDSFFEKEEYTTVSALLGEDSKPFLGIPTGPLQAGHFIGSLGIILMAFIEYPGFPLTNLPIPLRDFLQGGRKLHVCLKSSRTHCFGQTSNFTLHFSRKISRARCDIHNQLGFGCAGCGTVARSLGPGSYCQRAGL